MPPREAAPRDVALRILGELFAARDGPVGGGPVPEACSLVDFQAEGVARVRAILDRRGGAILADSVGLGKTYMALALIEETLRSSGDAVVVVPAATRRLWRRALRRLPAMGGGWRLLSHTQLARGTRVRPAPDGAGGHRLVVVDEAHRFRNPATLRYAALARLIARGARVLFLTATPVNNRADDLLHLVRLFAADDAFRDVGVPSLRDAFLAGVASVAGDGTPGTGSGRVAAVVRAVVVRRTRAMVRDRFGDPGPGPAEALVPTDPEVRDHPSAPAGPLPRFPRRAPPRLVRYADPCLSRLVGELADLELVPYAVRGPDSSGTPGSAALLRIGLLKRLDSSPAAFQASLHRLAQVLRATLDAARAGRVLAPGLAAPGRRPTDGDPLQLTLVELVARPAPPGLDLDAVAASLDRDLARVRRMGRLRGVPEPDAFDSKLRALDSLLTATMGEKTLVFTEYRDTAEALWRGLRDRHRVGRVDGSGAWLGRRRAGRRAVVERFAPRANGRRPPPDRERVDVLIATDVLAEGLNLQDARHVVSYELPWNPVRLLQRIGRVDRLGSPHAEVVPYLFAPNDGLELMLGLTRRLRTKLGHIAATVGAEQADELLERLAEAARPDVSRGDMDAAETLRAALGRAESDSTDAMEELRTLWIRHRSNSLPAHRRKRDDPPGATITVPSDSGEERIAWIVLARHAGTPVLLEVDADGVVREADMAACAVMERALRGAPGAGLSSAVPVGAIEEHLTRATASAVAPPRLSRHDPGLRLMRRLRQSMARVGAGLDPQVVARADALLARIATPLDPASEANVRGCLGEDGVAPLSARLTALLDAAETALAGRPETGSRGRREGPGITVVAALQIHVSDTPPRG